MRYCFRLCSFLILTLLFIIPTASAQNINLTVDATHNGQPFNRNMLGVGFGNWEFGWDKPMLGNPVYDKLANAYKKSDIGFLRYAGGNWNGGLAFDRQPMRDQGDFSYRGNTYYQNYGTDELAGLSAFAKAAGADVMIEVNVFKDDPGMWADMVKYTNIENNFDFKYWEIGNENEATWNSTYLNPDEYMRRFIAYEKAMKAVDPSIVVIGPTNASPANASNGSGGLNRDITELPGKLKTANGRDMGGISWHWYDGYQDNTIGNILRYAGPDGSAMQGNNAWSRSWGDKVPAAIEQYAIKGAPIMDVVSEINTLADNRNHIQQNHIAGLFLSDALPRLAANGVDMTALWLGYSEFGSSFGMVQHTGKGANMRLNSPYYVYYMLANFFGDQFVGSTPLTNEKISIWASRDSQDPGKIKLMISNLSDADIPATVAISGFAPVSGVYYELLPDSTLPGLSGNGDVDVYSNLNGKKIDINNFDTSAAGITANNLPVTATGFSRTFPKYSVTSVILSGSGSVTAIPTAIPTTANTTPPVSPTTIAPTAPSGSTVTPTGTTPQNCPRHPEGDANCDGKVNLSDLEIWTREFIEDSLTEKADFYTTNTCKARDGGTKAVCLDDLQIWTTTYLNGG